MLVLLPPGLSDAYLSVIKALQHACLAASRKLDISWVEASNLELEVGVKFVGSLKCNGQKASSEIEGQHEIIPLEATSFNAS